MAELRMRPRPPLSALVLGAFALIAVLGPAFAPWDPSAQVDPASTRYRPPGATLLEVPLADGRTLLADTVERASADGGEGDAWIVGRRDTVLRVSAAERGSSADIPDLEARTYLLGTDKFGRDVLSRLLHGARLTFVIAGGAALIAFLLGTAVGTAAGLGGRWLDSGLMRLVDGILAVPWIFLLIALAAVVPPGVTTLVVLLGGTAWTAVARIARAQTLALHDEPWMLAARAYGAGPVRRVVRHLLPNALPAILVEVALQLGALITAEASLSFLGLGIPVPLPSWGTMIAEARHDIGVAWWATVVPAAAVAGTVLAIHLAGDALRDRLDPRAAAVGRAA